jgi:hypothetical protein
MILMPEAWKDDEIYKLKEELRVTEELLETRNKLLEAIPACPVHGSQCVPHAMEWVKEQMAKDVEEFNG